MRTTIPSTILLFAVINVGAQDVEPVSTCEAIVRPQEMPQFSGDTTLAFGNQYDLQACAGSPGASWLPASGQSSEQVVSLLVAEDCTLEVTVTGEFAGPNQMDPAVYVTDACPASGPTPTLLDANCLGAADATGGLGTETFSVDLLDNNNYFLFIDGFLEAVGPYSVSLSGCQLLTTGGPEKDFDGVPDALDNCIFVPNADQRDSDGDGYGNICDADFNNDCIVNVADLGILRVNFFGDNADVDMNGDGEVNVVDLALLRISFFGEPGPSGPGGACD